MRYRSFFFARHFLHYFDLYGVQVNVPGEYGNVGIFVDQDALISALVKVPGPLMATIEVLVRSLASWKISRRSLPRQVPNLLAS